MWKFSSCDGCQLSVLDLEDELLALAGRIEIAQFLVEDGYTTLAPVNSSHQMDSGCSTRLAMLGSGARTISIRDGTLRRRAMIPSGRLQGLRG